MTPQELREQFEKEGKYPTMTYGMWLESRLIEAEQRGRELAWESWKRSGIQWFDDITHMGIKVTYLESYERKMFDQWYEQQSRKESQK